MGWPRLNNSLSPPVASHPDGRTTLMTLRLTFIGLFLYHEYESTCDSIVMADRSTPRSPAGIGTRRPHFYKTTKRTNLGNRNEINGSGPDNWRDLDVMGQLAEQTQRGLCGPASSAVARGSSPETVRHFGGAKPRRIIE